MARNLGGGGGNGKSTAAADDDESLRSRIHDFLSKRDEPLKPGVIASEMGLGASPQKIGKLVDHEWFERTPDGVVIA